MAVHVSFALAALLLVAVPGPASALRGDSVDSALHDDQVRHHTKDLVVCPVKSTEFNFHWFFMAPGCVQCNAITAFEKLRKHLFDGHLCSASKGTTPKCRSLQNADKRQRSSSTERNLCLCASRERSAERFGFPTSKIVNGKYGTCSPETCFEEYKQIRERAVNPNANIVRTSFDPNAFENNGCSQCKDGSKEEHECKDVKLGLLQPTTMDDSETSEGTAVADLQAADTDDKNDIIWIKDDDIEPEKVAGLQEDDIEPEEVAGLQDDDDDDDNDAMAATVDEAASKKDAEWVLQGPTDGCARFIKQFYPHPGTNLDGYASLKEAKAVFSKMMKDARAAATAPGSRQDHFCTEYGFYSTEQYYMKELDHEYDD